MLSDEAETVQEFACHRHSIPCEAVIMGHIRCCFLQVLLAGLLLSQALGPHSLSADEGVECMTLSAAVDAAVVHNPSLRALRNQRQAAEARTREARSASFPQLAVTAGYTRHQEPNIIVPIHRMGVFPPLDDQIYDVGFRLKVPVFTGGRTRANRRAAEASEEETEAQKMLALNALLQGIADVFIRAQEVADKEHLVGVYLNVLRRRYAEMAVLEREGRIPAADAALVNAFIQEARADSMDIAGKKRELAIRLGQLVGTNRYVYPQCTATDTTESGGGAAPDSALFERTGPISLRAQAQLDRADALRSAVVGGFWPEVGGFAGYTYRSGGDLDLFGEWAAGITVRMPVFEGGRRMAQMRAAKASVRSAEENLRHARQAQDAELRVAFEQWRSARARREALSGAIRSRSRAVAAYRRMYEAGRALLSGVLEQEADLLELQVRERGLACAERRAVLQAHAVAGTLTPETVRATARSLP